MDNKLFDRIFFGTDAASVPVSYVINGVKHTGLPDGMKTEKRRIGTCISETVFTSRISESLVMKLERLVYGDFACAEYTAYVTNDSDVPSRVISGFGIEIPLAGHNARVYHSNGEDCAETGFGRVTERIDGRFTASPQKGLSCFFEFPYMRLYFDEYSVNMAIGWPGSWILDIKEGRGTYTVSAGQRRFGTYLKPGETMRTPRLTLQAFTGGDEDGINAWRRFYFKHIMPLANGKPIGPMCCMHLAGAEGKPEFTAASEKNQLNALDAYLAHGIRPDVWWIDAGWYKCDYDWTHVGTWSPDAERFPRGLKPIGDKCAENGIKLLTWFEPERVRPGTRLAEEHPEWLLKLTLPDGTEAKDMLLDLGIPECREAVTDTVDAMIKASGIKIYRQDFNFSPEPYWIQNEAPDRTGSMENLHMQGYLRYWDDLLERNPGLIIDACAGGGRRNDPETMRRAVPLQYTDIGLGKHPLKLKQHRLMYEWIPYFRAHNKNWDTPDGEYGGANDPPDEFSYYVATAPALTDMTRFDADDAAYALAAKMQPIWRRAAQMTLECDYYPLTDAVDSNKVFYAMQFHDPDKNEGFVNIISNNRNPETHFVSRLRAVLPDAEYEFEEAETGEKTVYTGAELLNGFTVEMPPRTGRIYFYKAL